MRQWCNFFLRYQQHLYWGYFQLLLPLIFLLRNFLDFFIFLFFPCLFLLFFRLIFLLGIYSGWRSFLFLSLSLSFSSLAQVGQYCAFLALPPSTAQFVHYFALGVRQLKILLHLTFSFFGPSSSTCTSSSAIFDVASTTTVDSGGLLVGLEVFS